MVNLIAEICRKQGYHCTTFIDSPEAWQYFRDHPHAYDLVITDQTMPGLSGLELAANILRLREDMPIILCTGYSDVLENADTRRSGITGFLNKPFESQQLVSMIKELLEPEIASAEFLS